jgi:hypothetical protein
MGSFFRRRCQPQGKILHTGRSVLAPPLRRIAQGLGLRPLPIHLFGDVVDGPLDAGLDFNQPRVNSAANSPWQRQEGKNLKTIAKQPDNRYISP